MIQTLLYPKQIANVSSTEKRIHHKMECFLKGLGIFFLIVNHVFKHLGNKYNAFFFFFNHDQVSSPPDGKILGF